MKKLVRLIFLLLLVCSLLMTACGGAGPCYATGRYVLADSGRCYIVFKGDDRMHIVKMDGREGEDISFDGFQTGDWLEIRITVIREDGALEYVTVNGIVKRKAGSESDVPAGILEEIERIDPMWEGRVVREEY